MSVDAAGPALPDEMYVRPDDIRTMAAYVIDQCVRRSRVGGFVTNGMSTIVDYILNPATNLNARYPVDTVFITVTVSGPRDHDFQPGNTDPMVPVLFGGLQLDAYRKATPGSSEASLRWAGSRFWSTVAASMTRGGPVAWWSPSLSLASNEMTYECDSGLGSPSTVDCAQIEWGQLGPASDAIAVGPEKITFLHANTCNLAISASVTLVLTWAQIRTALATLMTTCVQHPFRAPQGGRAYFRLRPSQLSGRKSRKRDGLTGLNALPPHANITSFQQSETWTTPIDESRTCTWRAISNGHPTTTCK